MRFVDEAFFKTIRDFLTLYLPKQKCYSDNTINSYRIALNLFVDYLTDKCAIPLHKLSFNHLNYQTVTKFLDWLQDERTCGAATRNQRLMALRSFAKYAAKTDPSKLSLQVEVKNVEMQKAPAKIVEFLSEDALKALLAQPNRHKPIGVRDSFFMALMYDTAARCQEILDLRLKDFELAYREPYVYLTGKGDKTRSVPLLNKSVEHFKVYIDMFHPVSTRKNDDLLFYTTIHGKKNKMSPDTVASFIKKYGEAARLVCSSVPDRVHAHQLRHTRAIHLYRSGVPMALLSEYLGHVSMTTTKVYAYADTEMKRAAIRKADPNNDAVQESAIWEGDDDLIKKLYGLK
jgi:site-specific recombinase XerD